MPGSSTIKQRRTLRKRNPNSSFRMTASVFAGKPEVRASLVECADSPRETLLSRDERQYPEERVSIVP